jgi:hypothetical protein
MRLRLTRVKIHNCGTGIKSRGPLDLDADDREIKNCREAMDVAAPPKGQGTMSSTEPSKGHGTFKRDISVQVAGAIITSAILGSVGLFWSFFV